MPSTVASFEHAKKLFEALPSIVRIEGSKSDYTFSLNTTPVANDNGYTIYLNIRAKSSYLTPTSKFIICTYQGKEYELTADALGEDFFNSIHQKIQSNTPILTPSEQEQLINLLTINTNKETTTFINNSNKILQKTGFSLSTKKFSKTHVIDNEDNVFYLHALNDSLVNFERSFEKIEDDVYSPIEELYHHASEDGTIKKIILVRNEKNELYLLALDKKDAADTDTEIDTYSQEEEPQAELITRRLFSVSAIPLTIVQTINKSRFLTAPHRIAIALQCIAATATPHTAAKPQQTFNPENFIVSFAMDPLKITVKLEKNGNNSDPNFYSQALYDQHQTGAAITPTADSNNYQLGVNLRNILSPLSADEINSLDAIYEPKLQALLNNCEKLLEIDLTPRQENLTPDQLILRKVHLLKDFKTPGESHALATLLKTAINAAIEAYQEHSKKNLNATGYSFFTPNGWYGLENTTGLKAELAHTRFDHDSNAIMQLLSAFFNRSWFDRWSSPNANNHSFISYLMNELKQLDPAQLKSLNLGAEVVLDNTIDYCQSDMKASRQTFKQALALQNNSRDSTHAKNTFI